ncbi:DEAD/DEAH box helicase family protein [Thermomonospora umbrina]|uniref:Type III restriction/modification enzyme restriction subunit n=1 Tax=Thermomonospora umbrina TaxID=111806 RepID=A0A3D9SSA4_9ACTN|nr:DEAD/DEAH box helicase family protein [Thermomonospora umbrina]REE95504.1 type III restriction/modification enzyme restriction subunit [Thermomonospora umbrina]
MVFEDARWPGELRPYQSTALDRLAEGWAEGRRRAWVVLPPGTGKTLVGLEAARRLGRRTVVFVPNTAIQNQWADHWGRFGGSCGASRSLDAEVTVLTYQSLAVFDPDAETDEEGRQRLGRSGRAGGLVRLLHDNGRALISALQAAGPLTLVLDECHHLLDVWGRLLAEILEDLPDALVIGLTATPPESLTPDEAGLVDALFGVPIPGASIPAMVREGYLAPFTELAWLTEPTATEGDYIEGEAERFEELTTDLLAPGFAGTDFLPWLDARWVARTAGPSGGAVSWDRVEKDFPAIAGAALRLHHAGLLALPPGARIREEHRHAPTAEDWVALLNDYVRHCLLPGDPVRGATAGDAAAVEAIKRALPAVGYQLTRRGIRPARSPVDRVLARSAAKAYGAVEVAATEAAAQGARLRCLVLCDHERAGATLPARLREVLDVESGSAWRMLVGLVADPRTRDLDPMLVTGRTVAAAERTARAFALAMLDHGLELEVEPAGDGIALLTGAWSARTWVARVTAAFEEGLCRILVGTRGLLGEGWDARGINTLIDLTTATTPTAVVQTRGRALRLDPAWPGKAANTWSVVCVSDRHPKGTADWDRFVRKHRGYLVATPEGEIVSGVAHVHPSFSPYEPPPVTSYDRLNREMLERAEDREATRDAWRLGTPYRDELMHTLRIRTPVRPAAAEAAVPVPVGAPEPPQVLTAAACAAPAPPPPAPSPYPRPEERRFRAAFTLMAGSMAGLALSLFGVVLAALVVVPFTVAAVASARRTVRRRALHRTAVDEREAALVRAAGMLDGAAAEPSATPFAYAVADALRAVGLSRRGSDGVTVLPEPDGDYRFALADVDPATSERFVLALDEVLGPLANPRYFVPRYVVRRRTDPGERTALAEAWMHGRARADGVVYHAVPALFGQNRKRTDAFATAWNRWVSRGEVVYASSPEGAGILATHRGEDPFQATTVLRVAWD